MNEEMEVTVERKRTFKIEPRTVYDITESSSEVNNGGGVSRWSMSGPLATCETLADAQIVMRLFAKDAS